MSGFADRRIALPCGRDATYDGHLDGGECLEHLGGPGRRLLLAENRPPAVLRKFFQQLRYPKCGSGAYHRSKEIAFPLYTSSDHVARNGGPKPAASVGL